MRAVGSRIGPADVLEQSLEQRSGAALMSMRDDSSTAVATIATSPSCHARGWPSLTHAAG